MRLESLPLGVSFDLNMEGERYKLKRILLCGQVEPFEVVIERLFIGDVPVELEVVVKLELVSAVPLVGSSAWYALLQNSLDSVSLVNFRKPIFHLTYIPFVH
jgi:hypothetical protein